MEFENLLINTKNNITTISINRPKNLNALSIKTLEEIANAINLSIENDKTKCIIITGAGDKVRHYLAPFPPSSPAIALFKDGELVHMLERHHIEGRSAEAISQNLAGAYNEFC